MLHIDDLRRLVQQKLRAAEVQKKTQNMTRFGGDRRVLPTKPRGTGNLLSLRAKQSVNKL